MIPDKPRRRVTVGKMVVTASDVGPYKAVLTYEDGHTSEHPFHRLQEGEAFLRGHGCSIFPEP